MKRAPAAVQAASNRAVCSASIKFSDTLSPTVGSNGLPNGSGNYGKLPLLFSAETIQSRTVGETCDKTDVHWRSGTQKSSKLPASGKASGFPPVVNAVYMP